MMPGMSGYDVCRKIRENPATAMLPVVMVTALDPGQERVKGIDAGADDFLSKPINQPELLARVRSLLRVKELWDQLGELNRTLEARVTEQVAQVERLGRLKRFFSPHLAEAIVNGGADDPLKSHRREVTVVFIDLRGFTAFSETAEPEEVMGVLREYHAAMGELILAHEGTLERFTGDGMMIFFNDPTPVPNPQERAVRMALAMRERVNELMRGWRKLGYELDFGRRHRPGLRDHRRHRIRGAPGLRRHRDRHQPGRPAVRGGAARSDPRLAATARRRGRLRDRRAGRRAVAQGLLPARHRLQHHGAEARLTGAGLTAAGSGTAPSRRS